MTAAVAADLEAFPRLRQTTSLHAAGGSLAEGPEVVRPAGTRHKTGEVTQARCSGQARCPFTGEGG